MVTAEAGRAQPTERVFDNSRLYFSRVEIMLLPGEKRPALARLTCAEGFRVAGYQFIPPHAPVPSYPDNWAPISVTKVNYAVLNEWALELFNRAEPPRPPFPLTVGFVCVNTTKSS
jgi:hypothetical protein